MFCEKSLGDCWFLWEILARPEITWTWHTAKQQTDSFLNVLLEQKPLHQWECRHASDVNQVTGRKKVQCMRCSRFAQHNEVMLRNVPALYVIHPERNNYVHAMPLWINRWRRRMKVCMTFVRKLSGTFLTRIAIIHWWTALNRVDNLRRAAQIKRSCSQCCVLRYWKLCHKRINRLLGHGWLVSRVKRIRFQPLGALAYFVTLVTFDYFWPRPPSLTNVISNCRPVSSASR
jgi:hypothetical protein